MCSVNQKSRPAKSGRSIRWLSEPLSPARRWAAVRITSGKVETDYIVIPFKTDYGRGYALEKNDFSGDRYNVLLSDDGDTCDCKGFTFRHTCKHVTGLRVLLDRTDVPAKPLPVCDDCGSPLWQWNDSTWLCPDCTTVATCDVTEPAKLAAVA